MPEENKTVELNDYELENVSGGTAHIMGYTNYIGTCICGSQFKVSTKRPPQSENFTCSCGIKYELIDCSVYCNGVKLSSGLYSIIDCDN